MPLRVHFVQLVSPGFNSHLILCRLHSAPARSEYQPEAPLEKLSLHLCILATRRSEDRVGGTHKRGLWRLLEEEVERQERRNRDHTVLETRDQHQKTIA
jgi:hypothetical protein